MQLQYINKIMSLNVRKIFIFLVLLLFFQSAWSETRKTVCLNMIVKNEKDVIERCLKSVLPLIDSWAIVDTGSTDGTQMLIKSILKDIPGELYEKTWVNFSHNRNQALELAKGKSDYILFMDADDILFYESSFKMPNLDKDFYITAVRKRNQISKPLPRLVKSNGPWRWEGVVHEYLLANQSVSGGILENIEYVCFEDGIRFKEANTNIKDAHLLELAVKENSKDSRSLFYLARAYQSIGRLEEALETFNKRIQMKGSPEEIYLSKLSIAQVQDLLNKPLMIVKECFLDAYKQRPHRRESLYYLVEKLKEEGDYEKGFQVTSYGLKTSTDHGDELFVEKEISDIGFLMQYILCAGKTGRFKEGIQVCHQVLEKTDISATCRARVKEYLQYLQLQSMKKLYAQIEDLVLEKT